MLSKLIFIEAMARSGRRRKRSRTSFLDSPAGLLELDDEGDDVDHDDDGA